MGGPSTDVSHYAGEFERVFDSEVAGVRLRAPMMNIHTVAAGGGALAAFDGARWRVGRGWGGPSPGRAGHGSGGPRPGGARNASRGRRSADLCAKVGGP